MPPVKTTQNSPTPATFGLTDLGLVLTAVIWGAHYSVLKVGLQTLPPFTFSAIRLVSAFIILMVLAASVRTQSWPSRRDTLALVGCGLIGNGLYQLMFMEGMTTTRAGIAALIIAASPAWVAIIGRLMGRERVSSRGWMGIGLQLAGVACVVLSTNMLTERGSALTGTLLIIGGGVLWSLYSVLLQPFTERIHPMHLSAITLSGGASLMLLVALPDLVHLDFRTVTVPAWSALAYSSIGAMVIAYMLFYRGIRELGPTRTAVYGNLQPIVAILVAWGLVHEAPTVWQWVGAAMITGGLLLSRTAIVHAPDTERHTTLAREARTV
ncbi:MAG: DMT family transporter [Gemmatimonadota bacterium]|nr:DMT family transporter [Gemmatimonadota bacterium]